MIVATVLGKRIMYNGEKYEREGFKRHAVG